MILIVDKEIRVDGGNIMDEGPGGTEHLLGSGGKPVYKR